MDKEIIKAKELNLASLKSRITGNLSAKEALKDVTPFDWSKETESGTNEEFDEMARWKGAGMGEYYCSRCCEVGDVRERRCPKCNALMYTDEEYNRMLTEWELEDLI